MVQCCTFSDHLQASQRAAEGDERAEVHGWQRRDAGDGTRAMGALAGACVCGGVLPRSLTGASRGPANSNAGQLLSSGVNGAGLAPRTGESRTEDDPSCAVGGVPCARRVQAARVQAEACKGAGKRRACRQARQAWGGALSNACVVHRWPRERALKRGYSVLKDYVSHPRAQRGRGRCGSDGAGAAEAGAAAAGGGGRCSRKQEMQQPSCCFRLHCERPWACVGRYSPDVEG